ncbi:MAG: hypothetical protein ACI825_000718 [Planctomycetota bacterium]|jgi:hypothetical protein|uniref:DUF3570 domain-containing protein n=1 Tax=Patiriisocius sp. Uisw_047 TaxID=3230969 RepID=UPI0039EA7237
MKNLLYILLLFPVICWAQDSTATYTKRVLETTEVEFLTSYYSQEGKNAAVTGGRGTEELTDFTPTIVVSIPLNDSDVLTIDAGISAYTSASSSNVGPFDGAQPADPFVASSGASGSDTWANINGSYSHSSPDRNRIWGAHVSLATEYDYTSVGIGGNYTYLFNEKNTEVSLSGNVYLDQWKIIYPEEIRFELENETDFDTLDGFADGARNSYSVGFGFSQILSKKAQFSLSLDLIQQKGLLSTPFHRIYFADRPIFMAENFPIAHDIERLPDTRFKVAIGGRFNYYLSETFVLRSYYRYYSDDFGITSNTASLEIPIKIGGRFTLYPGYRYYQQSASAYFNGYAEALSTDEFYTSDFDLSEFNANQFSVGINYTDIFTGLKVFDFGLKSIDLKVSTYERNTGLNYFLISGGVKFVMD